MIILSLSSRRLNVKGAVSAMLVGALTVIVWKPLKGGLFDIYEILPAFILSCISAIAVSRLTGGAGPSVEAQFDEVSAEIAKL